MNIDHPDLLLHQQSTKAITCGGTQAADDIAMEAMWQAIEAGKGKEEANKIFSQTYIKVYDSNRSTKDRS